MTLDHFLCRLLLTPLARNEMPSRGIPSAVVLVLRERRHQVEILLSRRSGGLRHHPHQICFPGGRHDSDDNNLWQTAERECEEELGISQGRLTCIARLPPHYTRSGYAVQPFVATLGESCPIRHQPDEVSEAFWLPLAPLLKRERYAKLQLDALPLPLIFLPTSNGLIWGVTAAILYRLARRLHPGGSD